jgi:hypothetical protein
MTRFVLLAVALLSINPLTDWLVDFRFKQAHESKGYSDGQVAGMKRRLDRELVRKPVSHHKAMTGEEQAAAMVYLWGEGK